jgi:hypothetical protein
MKPIFFAVLGVVCLASSSFAQDVPRFEIGAGASFLRDPSNLNRYGWLGSFGTNINRWFAVKGEVAGHYSKGSGTVHSVLAGPQFNLRRDGARVTPWLHFLVGAQREEEFFVFTGVGTGSSFIYRTRWAVQPGGGLDVSLNSKVSLRFGVDYVRAVRDRLRDSDYYRLHSGFVFKLP